MADQGEFYFQEEVIELCECGARAEVGAHEIRGLEVISASMCEPCYRASRK